MLPCYEHKWVITDVRLWDMNQSNHNQSSCCTNHLVPLTATSVKLRRPKRSSIAPYSKTKVNISKFIDSTSTDVDILCIYHTMQSKHLFYKCLLSFCKGKVRLSCEGLNLYCTVPLEYRYYIEEGGSALHLQITSTNCI